MAKLKIKDEHGKDQVNVYQVASDDSLPMPEELRGKWAATSLPVDELVLDAYGHYSWRQGNSDPMGCGDENGCPPTTMQGLVTTIKIKGDARGQLVLDGRKTFNFVLDGKSLTLTGASGTNGKHVLRAKGR